MNEDQWWAPFERFRLLDALHEAGHAVAATLLGAVGVQIHLDPENWDDRRSTDFDLDPSLSEPEGGWKVDLDGGGTDPLVAVSRDCDLSTRLWVVTRAGGVGCLVGSHVLGFEVEVEVVMDGCEHDDRALERLLDSTPETRAQRWVELRYLETWALLMRHETAVVAVARLAIERDWERVQIELGRLSDRAGPATASQDEVAGAGQLSSAMGFGSWPDWRAHERRRFEEFKGEFR